MTELQAAPAETNRAGYLVDSYREWVARQNVPIREGIFRSDR